MLKYGWADVKPCIHRSMTVASVACVCNLLFTNPLPTMVWLKCVSVTFARRVLWLCPGHIYSRVPDTYTIVPWTRSISVSSTHSNVSLPHLYMEKDKNIDTFQALTRFSNHSAEETCEDFGNYICSVNWTQNLGAYTVLLYHMAKRTLLVNTCYVWYIIATLLV